MTVPGNIDALLLGGQRGYQIERSLRFNSADSAYLSRTPASAGNRKTWTWSCWVKRSKITSQQTLFRGGAGSTNSTYVSFYFRDVDTLYFGGWTSNFVRTTSVFRDASAWYHIVLSVDTTLSSNRIKIYVNNVEQTLTQDAGYPAQNDDLGVNQAALHTIGGNDAAGGYADYYLTEVHFIDGQALTPSSFGETDTITGVWKPKRYSGSGYGTNGFYLKFADNSGTTSTTLGKDSSGNGNNWTPNNFSVTAGAGNDSLIDTPTPYADGGNGRGNYCTWNPLTYTGTISNGNLDLTTFVSYSATRLGTATFEMSTGSWYWEIEKTSGSATTLWVGIANNPMAIETSPVFVYGSGGTYYESGSTVATGKATYATNDIIGIAVNAATKTIQFYKNGTSQGSYTMSLAGPYFAVAYDGDSGVNCIYSVNFGQRPFAYTPPSGFLALNTQNLPEPSIKKPSSYMDVLTWSGTGGGSGATRSLTGLGFSPDFVWQKARSSGTNHRLLDAIRGAGTGKTLSSNTTSVEGDGGSSESLYGYLSSFDSNGFTLTNGTSTFDNGNKSGDTYVAWCWDESATPGFDIVTYTGNGAASRTVAHNLGVAPSMIIVKNRGTVTASWNRWATYHSSLGATQYLGLNETTSATTSANAWNNTAPTSTNFTVVYNAGAGLNGNGETFVAYLWSEVAGFSKFGSYTGNGSADGPFVHLGFRPRYLLVKRSDSANDWLVFDSARDQYNETDDLLYPNLSNAEASNSATDFDFLSNGFKLRAANANQNASGGTYIFAAFAESPFKYSLAR